MSGLKIGSDLIFQQKRKKEKKKIEIKKIKNKESKYDTSGIKCRKQGSIKKGIVLGMIEAHQACKVEADHQQYGH